MIRDFDNKINKYGRICSVNKEAFYKHKTLTDTLDVALWK